MPRVYTLTKSTRGKTYNCAKCGQPITAGQVYHDWTRRFGRSGITYRQHASCGRPTPTQLSSRKTAQIEEVLMGISFDDIGYQLTGDQAMEADVVVELGDVVDQCREVLQQVADVAREVGEEYQAGVDNMPEGLQQGPTGEAMTAVAEELEQWAGDLEEGPTIANTVVDLPDPAEHDNDEGAWRQAAQDAIDEAVAEIVEEALGLTEGMPEYQG